MELLICNKRLLQNFECTGIRRPTKNYARLTIKRHRYRRGRGGGGWLPWLGLPHYSRLYCVDNPIKISGTGLHHSSKGCVRFPSTFLRTELQPFRIRLNPVVATSSLPVMFKLNSTIACLILDVALSNWSQMEKCAFAKFLGIVMVVFMVN